MKVKYIGDYYKVRFIKGNIYEAEKDIESDWYKLTDETGDEGLCPPEMFEIVED